LYEPVVSSMPDINVLKGSTDSFYRLSTARENGSPTGNSFYTILCNPLLVTPAPLMIKIYSDISTLGLSRLFELGNLELITIHEGMFENSGSVEMDDMLYSEMIKHGIIRFLNMKTNSIINYNSGVIKSSIGRKIREKVANPLKRVFITEVQHESVSSVTAEDDFISTHEEVGLIAKSIGMLIPPHTADVYKYYMDNYKEYNFVDDINGDIDTSSDEMIFKSLGVYFLYESRKDLVQQAERFLAVGSTTVFIPYEERYFTEGINRVRGDMPTSLEGQEDIMEAGTGISIGNYYSSYTLSVDELLYQFRQNPPGLDFATVTMNPELTFSMRMIYRIIGLLIMSGSDLLEEMVEHVRERIENRMTGGIDYTEIKDSYEELDSESRKQVAEWFDALFLTGMYFRRWDGKGPYPMSSNSTRELSAQYAEEKGGDQAIKMSRNMEGYSPQAMMYIKSFRTFDVTYSNKSIFESPYYHTIYLFLTESVLSGNFCIRIASNLLIATATTFKEKALKSSFNGFSISVMDLIA
jgi:hypothetical protein